MLRIFSLHFYVIEVIHQYFLPTFRVLAVQIFDKVENSPQILIFP